MDSIPVIDISSFVLGGPWDEKQGVAKAIGEACRLHGFFYIKKHGVDKKLVDQLEAMSRDFFQLPLETKMKIAMPLGGRAWRGYFPVGGELTSGKPDMKEGIYFGAELPADHPMVVANVPLHGANLFPDLPGFKEVILRYLDELTRLGHTVMRGIALSLNLKEDYFVPYFSPEPLPLFRIFNYPATENETEVHEGWGVGEHTDYGVLTLLKQDHLGGLEVKSRGKWVNAPPIDETFVCNIGDMLDRLTGGLYKSTPHRVRRPQENQDRISFPFFFDPNFNAVVKPIEGIDKPEVQEDEDQRWDKSSVHKFEGTYGDYLLLKVSKVFPELKQNVL